MAHQENFHTDNEWTFAPFTADRFLSRDLPDAGRFASRDECEVLLDDIKCLQLTEDSFSAVSQIVRENRHWIGDFKRIVDKRTRGTRQEYLNCCMELYRLESVFSIEDDDVLKFQVLSQFLFYLNIIPESVAEYRRAVVGQVKDDVETLLKLWGCLCSFNVQCTLQLAAYDDVISSLRNIRFYTFSYYGDFVFTVWIIYKMLKVPDIQTQQKLLDVFGDLRTVFVKENNIFECRVLTLLLNDDQIEHVIFDDDIIKNVYKDVINTLDCRSDRFLVNFNCALCETVDDMLSTLCSLFRNKEIRHAVIGYYDDDYYWDLIDEILCYWQSHEEVCTNLLTLLADCTLTCLHIERGLWRIMHTLVADSRTQSVDGIVALRERVVVYSHKLVPDFLKTNIRIELNPLKTLLAELQLDEPHVVNWLENVKLYPHVCVGYELVVKCILSFETCPATEVLKCMKELHSYLRYNLLDVYTEMFGEFLTDVKFFEETWRKYSLILNSLGREHYDDSIDQQENVDTNSKEILFYIRQVWIVTSSYGKLCCDQLIACGVINEIYFNMKDVDQDDIDQTKSFSFTSSLYILYYLASHTKVSHRGDIKDLLLEKFNRESSDLIGFCIVHTSTEFKNLSRRFLNILPELLNHNTNFTYLPFITEARFRNKQRRLDFLRVVHKSGGLDDDDMPHGILRYIQENRQCTQHAQVILNQLDKLVINPDTGHTMKKQRLLLATLEKMKTHDDNLCREAAEKLRYIYEENEDDEDEDMEVLEDREDDDIKTEREEGLRQRLEEINVPFSKVKYLFSVWTKKDVIKSALAILDVTSVSSCSAIEVDTGQRIDTILHNRETSATLLTEFNRWPEMANVALTLVKNRKKVPDLVDVDKTIDKVMKLFELANIKGEVNRNNVLKDLTLRTSKLTCLTVKQTFRFLLFLVKMFDSEVDQQCLSEKELKTVLQNWSSNLSRTNDDLCLVMFVIISMITDVRHGQHLLVYQDTIQELKQRLVTSLHLSQVTFQVYCGENEERLGICNILLHLQRLSQQETFRAEFPEHCLFHLQSILLQSCWTKQLEIELCLQILATYKTCLWPDIIEDYPSLLCSLHACEDTLQDLQFTTQANNATQLLDLIGNSSHDTDAEAQNIEMEAKKVHADTEGKRKSHPSTQVRHGCRNLNKRRRFGEIDELEVEERRTKLEKEKVDLEISKLKMREKEERLEKHDVEIKLKKQKHEQRMREREEKLKRMEIKRHILEKRLLEQKLHKEESKRVLTSSHEILDVAGPSYTQL